MDVLQNLLSQYKDAQPQQKTEILSKIIKGLSLLSEACLLYTSPSPRD